MVLVPKGYLFATVRAGFKYQDRDDLAFIFSQSPASTAAVFTKNRFQAAPILVAKEILERRTEVRGILVNAGQANACTGETGYKNCRQTLQMLRELLALGEDEILPASTGVIGEQFDLEKWKKAIPELKSALGRAEPVQVAKAIMTTDTFPKLSWKRLDLREGQITFLGLAKGAGMICPDMATMLGFVLCDAQVDPEWWAKSLREAVDASFNAITVDGDTSTNDCVLALANGEARVRVHPDEQGLVSNALQEVCQDLAYQIVQDAEGGTKVIHIQVTGAKDEAQAEVAARTIGHSPLVKTALYGQDPNWGRIVAALGRSGAEFDPNQVRVEIAGITLFAQGQPVKMDIDNILARHLRKQDVHIQVCLGNGPGEYTLLSSDLTEEYVRINACYRT
jgi:glutamate N-acetyltransferase/amino-acid N-acetyltransferase